MGNKNLDALTTGAQEELAGGGLLDRTVSRQAGGRPPVTKEDRGHVTSNGVTQERTVDRPAKPRTVRAEAPSRVTGAVEDLRDSGRSTLDDTIQWRREIPRNVAEHARELSSGAFVGSTLKIPERASIWMEEYLHRKNRGRSAKDKISKQALLALALQRLIADVEAEEGIIDQ